MPVPIRMMPLALTSGKVRPKVVGSGELPSPPAGTTFANVMERGDYDPAQHACLSIPALEEILVLFCVDYYPQRFNRHLGGRPIDLWRNDPDRARRPAAVSATAMRHQRALLLALALQHLAALRTTRMFTQLLVVQIS